MCLALGWAHQRVSGRLRQEGLSLCPLGAQGEGSCFVTAVLAEAAGRLGGGWGMNVLYPPKGLLFCLINGSGAGEKINLETTAVKDWEPLKNSKQGSDMITFAF